MPKQIKFNLIIDKKPVRDVEGLLENFNIEDLLEAYQNGSLKRWLLVRDMAKEAAELDKIKGDAVEAALELCRIFNAECTKEQLKQAAYPFEFRQKFKTELEKMETLKNQRAEIILSYHDGYDKLLDAMEANGDNYAFLKAAINDIFLKFRGLFIFNLYNFYHRFIFDYPLVILAVLANSEMRVLLTQVKSEEQIFQHITNYYKHVTDSYSSRYKAKIPIPFTKRCETEAELAELQNKKAYVFVLEFITDSLSYSSGGSAMASFETKNLKPPFIYVDKNLPIVISPYVQSFAKATDDYWLDVMPRDKKCMVIQMELGNFVRNAGKNGEKLVASDVNGKFLLFDGIDYMSKNDRDCLIFMEV